MSYQPYNPPAPTSNPGKKTALIIIAVVVVLCCLCTTIAGGGAAAFLFWQKPAQQTTNLLPTPIEEAVQVQEETPFVFEEETPEEPAIPKENPFPQDTPLPVEEPTEAPPANNPDQPAGSGLSVSRQEMINFYSDGGAFTFGDPTEISGLEIIMGTHTWLCVDTNCAAVTLGGPEDDLQVVAIVVPTDPDDSAQTTLSLLLLMTTAARFTDAQDVESVPTLILTDLTDAQSSGENFEKQIESSGYIFTESYDATTHNAGLAVSRPKQP